MNLRTIAEEIIRVKVENIEYLDISETADDYGVDPEVLADEVYSARVEVYWDV